jgi:hypothetical protein
MPPTLKPKHHERPLFTANQSQKQSHARCDSINNSSGLTDVLRRCTKGRGTSSIELCEFANDEA